MGINPEILIGCCGFPLGRAGYFRRFNLVEVQQTFYQPPRVDTLRRWRAEAPEEFTFTLKAWQLITHEPSSPTYRRLKEPVLPEKRNRYGSFRQTDEVLRAWHVTLEAAHALDAPVIIFQTPASFAPSPEHRKNLSLFFSRVSAECGSILPGWEPRGNWPRELVRKLCRDLGLLCVVDPFAFGPVADDIRYYRLHGIGGYRYRYTDGELAKLAGWCGERLTYCLFNNTEMAGDAERFTTMIRAGATGEGDTDEN
jgi:uncharacterized protein YecE (DUF72 family)